MVTAAKIDDKIETRHIMMRAYGNTYTDWAGGPQPFLTYSRWAEGTAHATDEKTLYAAMPDYRNLFRKKVEDGVYVLSKKKRHLYDASTEELAKAIIEAIRKEKGTMKLWTAADNIEGYMGHEVLTGEVPSRSSGVDSKTLARWPVTIKSPLFRYRQDGRGIEYSALNCGCQDFDWGTAKGASMICAHIAAEIKTAWDEQSMPLLPEQRRIEYFKAEGSVFLPYNVSTVDAIDVIARRYLLGQDAKDIDREELDSPDRYNPLFLDYIQKDRIVFEAVRQGNKHRKPKNSVERQVVEQRNAADDHLSRDTYWSLHNAGFRKVGLYGVEFKGTPYEALAETYVRDNEVVRPVFSTEFPPFIVHWRLSDRKDIFGEQSDKDPFVTAGETITDIEDRTRYIGEKTIIIPGTRTMLPDADEGLAMPPVYRREYVSRIPSERLRALGVALF